MPSVISQPTDVNSMKATNPHLTRQIGIRLAMQALADWDRNRRGLATVPLRTLPRDDQAAYKQTVERVVSEFERGAYGKEPADREVVQKAERDAYLLMERQRARLAAASRGHELTNWVTVDGRFDELATCSHYRRVACLVVAYTPLLEITRQGSALDEGCLALAATETR